MLQTASPHGSKTPPDILTFLAESVAADAVIIVANNPAGDSTTLASLPAGLSGRPMPISASLAGACGQGIQSAANLLLPSFMTGWLGFRPNFVASSRLHWHGGNAHTGEGCLFFFWRDKPRDQPTDIPTLTASLKQAEHLASCIAERDHTAITLRHTQDRLEALLANVSLGIVFIDLLEGCRLNPMAASFSTCPTPPATPQPSSPPSPPPAPNAPSSPPPRSSLSASTVTQTRPPSTGSAPTTAKFSA